MDIWKTGMVDISKGGTGFAQPHAFVYNTVRPNRTLFYRENRLLI